MSDRPDERLSSDEASIATPPRGLPRPSPAAPPSREVDPGEPPAAAPDAAAPDEAASSPGPLAESDPAAHQTARPPSEGAPAPSAVTGFTTDVPGPLLPPAGRPRGRRSTTIATVVALVVGLVGTAWFATDHLRSTWLPAQPHVAAPVDDDGRAELAGISVRLVEATDLGPTPTLGGSDWQPPAGYHAWRVVLETTSTNEEISRCEVDLVDDRGRVFRTNLFVDGFADGYEWTYTCSIPDPDDDVGPEQALLALAPAGATMETVRISPFGLSPDYLELEID